MTSLRFAPSPLPDLSQTRSRRGLLGALALSLALAGCVSAPGGGPARPSQPGSTKVPSVRPPAPTGARDPSFQTLPGLDGVIGVTERELERQFGPPRLRVWEGDARKLQFTGRACLLDVYLYPTSGSKNPVATYVDARRASDGQDVDRAACVAALRQK